MCPGVPSSQLRQCRCPVQLTNYSNKYLLFEIDSRCLTLPRAPLLDFDARITLPTRLATLIYRSLHGLAPQYLADDLCCVTDIPGRRRLRSSSSFQLEVPRTRLVTVGDRTFSAAGSRLWNTLPCDVTECQTLDAFRRKLKHFLFSLSFPGH